MSFLLYYEGKNGGTVIQDVEHSIAIHVQLNEITMKHSYSFGARLFDLLLRFVDT